ncbi:MAG TPA: hypothetical protein VFI84_04545, partial [Candidatus Saccharimonadales bacterium]|nr:hypothetical protein [Candidatus Saccharimonadales bacterium]
MPATFVFAIILVVIALLLGAATLWYAHVVRRQAAQDQASEGHDAQHRDYDSYRSSSDFDARTVRNWLAWIALGVLALAMLFTFVASATVVSTKNVGIVTSFGKPVGSLSNGFHMVAPWAKVTELDAAIQTDSHYKG